MGISEKQAKDQEIAELKRKLKARRDQAGYESNVKAIEARIAELEAEE